jgi:hypothetical protein
MKGDVGDINNFWKMVQLLGLGPGLNLLERNLHHPSYTRGN